MTHTRNIHFDSNQEGVALEDLNSYDVLCGRCTTCYNNVGNRRFRLTISMNVPVYRMARTKTQKGLVIASIMRSIKASGGRFFRPKNGRFIRLEAIKVREKVGHALRDLSVITMNKKTTTTTTGTETDTGTDTKTKTVKAKAKVRAASTKANGKKRSSASTVVTVEESDSDSISAMSQTHDSDDEGVQPQRKKQRQQGNGDHKMGQFTIAQDFLPLPIPYSFTNNQASLATEAESSDPLSAAIDCFMIKEDMDATFPSAPMASHLQQHSQMQTHTQTNNNGLLQLEQQQYVEPRRFPQEQHTSVLLQPLPIESSIFAENSNLAPFLGDLKFLSHNANMVVSSQHTSHTDLLQPLPATTQEWQGNFSAFQGYPV